MLRTLLSYLPRAAWPSRPIFLSCSLRWARLPRRSSGQTMVVAALALAGLLSFTALVLNVGMFVVERRGMQNAVDAAALVGARKLMEEQTSRSFRDAVVNDAITTLARQNDPK